MDKSGLSNQRATITGLEDTAGSRKRSMGSSNCRGFGTQSSLNSSQDWASYYWNQTLASSSMGIPLLLSTWMTFSSSAQIMMIERDRASQELFLSQHAYIEKFLRELGMSECKTASTPVAKGAQLQPAPEDYNCSKTDKLWYAKAIGSLMYAMLGTRPDIALAVSLCSRFRGNPTQQHIEAVKQILRYLKGTIDMVLCFFGPLAALIGYTDTDWAGDHDTRPSTGGSTSLTLGAERSAGARGGNKPLPFYPAKPNTWDKHGRQRKPSGPGNCRVNC